MFNDALTNISGPTSTDPVYGAQPFLVPDTNIYLLINLLGFVLMLEDRPISMYNLTPPRGVELDHKSVFNSTLFEFKIIDPVESLHLFKACAVIKIFVSPTKTELVAHPSYRLLLYHMFRHKFVIESVVFGIGPALCVNPLGPFQSYV